MQTMILWSNMKWEYFSSISLQDMHFWKQNIFCFSYVSFMTLFHTRTHCRFNHFNIIHNCVHISAILLQSAFCLRFNFKNNCLLLKSPTLYYCWSCRKLLCCRKQNDRYNLFFPLRAEMIIGLITRQNLGSRELCWLN